MSKIFYVKSVHFGLTLNTLMIEINLWANKYFSLPEESKAVLKEVRKGKEKFIKDWMKELKKV